MILDEFQSSVLLASSYGFYLQSMTNHICGTFCSCFSFFLKKKSVWWCGGTRRDELRASQSLVTEIWSSLCGQSRFSAPPCLLRWWCHDMNTCSPGLIRCHWFLLLPATQKDQIIIIHMYYIKRLKHSHCLTFSQTKPFLVQLGLRYNNSNYYLLDVRIMKEVLKVFWKAHMIIYLPCRLFIA